MSKRVLYLGGFCMPDGNAAAQRVLGIGKLMRQSGCDVEFHGLCKGLEKPATGCIEDFNYINYPYPTNPTSWIKYLSGHDHCIRSIKTYKPDLVVLYNHPAAAIDHITKYCHKRNIKVIADITEWYEATGNPIFKAIKKYDINRRMTVSHKKLDGLICISDYLYDYYKSSKLPIVNIPPLVDLSQPKWHQPISDSDTIKIIYAGSVGVAKDQLDIIISAFDEIKDQLTNKVEFVVIGLTLQKYQTKWKDYNNHDSIKFIGRLSHNDVIKHLLSADFQIFIRPDNLQNRAGFPTKYVETVTSLTLPISNLSSNLENYICDNRNGFVIYSYSIDGIKNTLLRALNNNKGEIRDLKTNLEPDLFDYHKYIGTFRQFVTTVFHQ